jgi:hypothetical protein
MSPEQLKKLAQYIRDASKEQYGVVLTEHNEAAHWIENYKPREDTDNWDRCYGF